MPSNIPRRLPGGTFFFTTRLADRSSTLLTDEIDRLRDATRRTLVRYPFRIDAIAVLPAAIHTIWTLPPDDANYSVRWGMLKSLFSKGLPDPPTRTPGQRRRGAKGIWQHRFWQHALRDDEDLARHIAMIHASPVQAGLCATPQDWMHSSVHRYIAAQGTLPDASRHGAARRPLASPETRHPRLLV